MLCCVSLFILGNLCKVRKFVQPVAEVYVYGSRINNRGIRLRSFGDFLLEKDSTLYSKKQIEGPVDADIEESTDSVGKVQAKKTGKKIASSLSNKALKKFQQQQNTIDSQLKQFHHCYESQFTKERWEQKLFPALIQPTNYVGLTNNYVQDRQFLNNLLQITQKQTIPYLSNYFDNVYIHTSDAPEARLTDTLDNNTEQVNNQTASVAGDEEIETDEHSTRHWPSPGVPSSLDPITNLCCYYPLDAASLFPILLMDLRPSHSILDMCSAPGGKALSILQKLSTMRARTGESTAVGGSLTCNDVSPGRKIRLQNVIRKYIPRDLPSYDIQVTNHDLTNPAVLRKYFATSASSSSEEKVTTFRQFDRILLDAPCSSERHLLQEFYRDFSFLIPSSESSSSLTTEEKEHQLFQKCNSVTLNKYELIQWSPGRSKANAERQYHLLMNAVKLIAFAPSGRIVYSTCSLNEIENDQVIEKVLNKTEKYKEKNGYRLESIPVDSVLPDLVLGEKTKYGWHLLPDNAHGFGPIYMAVLEKVHYP
jgi:16S rRNA C967 or C1407 C5-methylase (RsmB/RsmF family)